MKKFLGVSIALSLTLVLMIMSCASPTDDVAGSLGQAEGRFVISQDEIDNAIKLEPTKSDRKNASGPKIPSNAHSSDFPGIDFCWVNKQKDDAYLKVNAPLLRDLYEGFVFTVKISSDYWDYDVTEYVGQDDVGGTFVFKIARTGGKNINMAFIPEIKVRNESKVLIVGDDIAEGDIIVEDDVIVDGNGIVSTDAEYSVTYYVDVQKEVKGKALNAWIADAKYFTFNGQPLDNTGKVTFEADNDGSYDVTETISMMTNKYVGREIEQGMFANRKKGSIELSKTIKKGDNDSIEYTVKFDIDGEIVGDVVISPEDFIGEVVSGRLNTLVFTTTDDVLTVSIQINFESAYGEVNTFTNYLNGTGNGGGNRGTATNVSGKTLFHDENTKTYATLNKADLEAGYVPLNVYGDNANLPYVGKAFVELVNGQLVITIDGENESIKAARATYDSKAISSLHNDKDNGGGFKNGHTIDISGTPGDTIYLYVWVGEANFYKSSEK